MAATEPEATTSMSTTTPADPTGEPIDDPANDGCVPQDDVIAVHEAVLDSSTGEPDPSSSSGGTAGDTEGDTEGDTDAESDTDFEGDTDGAEECAPLPSHTPSKLDTNCTCDIQNEHRACKTPDAQDGTRYCDGGEWGPCIVEPACDPGAFIVCYYCDEQFGTMLSDCLLHDGVPVDNSGEDCATPLVLSFDGRAVEYTSAHAEFAMAAGDGCGARDWPTAATPWLAIDLDRNGNIDGGHELFGTGSRLAGRVDNGFAALAALDSNADGQISGADARFAEIVVWSDHDADRRSNLWELQPLASHGVVAIDLGYQVNASRCDARGNCEGERASFVFESADGARSSGEIVDVRLSCQ